MGICYECSTKHLDSSEKKVSHCEICNKWFCEAHLKPKVPYFINWDTVFDVQSDPKIKALFHTEYNREGGHPDFVYLRKTIEAFDLEEKTRNELIRQAMDRMMNPEKYDVEVEADYEKDTTKRVEILLKEENELKEHPEYEHPEKVIGDTTTTFGNIHNYHFGVPTQIYNEKEYRKRLDNARTLAEVDQIVEEYWRHHRKTPKEE